MPFIKSKGSNPKKKNKNGAALEESINNINNDVPIKDASIETINTEKVSKKVNVKGKRGRKRKVELEEEVESTPFMDMKADFWDVIAPEGVGILDKDADTGVMKQSLGTLTHFRPFYIPRDGWPRKLRTNWLSNLTSSGECDVMLDIQKIPKSSAIRMLQKQNTILKSNLYFQIKRGNQDQIRDLQTKIEDNEILADETQFSENDSYHVGVVGMLYADEKRQLDKYSEFVEDNMAGLFFKMVSTWGRLKKGFRSATPLSKNEIPDSMRNVDRRALSTFAPFISGSGKFNGGIPIGINQRTGQKEFYNAFGTPENRPDNYNMAILGVSGSGKSIAMKLLLARETTGMNVYSRLIDVEGEFLKIVRRLGGINISLSEESKIRINPLAINVSTIPYDEEDEELDELENSEDRVLIERDGQMYIQFVPIREKINEVTEFFDIICRGKNQEGEGLTVFERNFLEEALKYLYTEDPRFMFGTHPSTLYTQKPLVKDGLINQVDVKKPEPTISDVYNYLSERFSEEENCLRLLAAIRPFLKDGSKPIFDGQTYFGKELENVDIHTTRLVNFNLKDMEEGFLRPVAYHVILNYLWEYFVKNSENEIKKKIVYADEFWTMVDNDQTVSFAEKLARRARKRNCGFRIASQDFVRILQSKKARGVLQNTYTNLFFQQNQVDLSLIEESFNLTRGERALLFENPEKGEGILRVGKSSVHLRTDPSEEELNFIESNAAVLAERRKQRSFYQKVYQ
ncbi:VirB4 family type IV secretion system protein [Solibacillus sp. NPDC093137]|uniref:VirB4 family type IV secretion system protein n=1 Tax=Solibacillus sp. NPDC093137 TaxID=3390678 RepID=UPI003D02618B